MNVINYGAAAFEGKEAAVRTSEFRARAEAAAAVALKFADAVDRESRFPAEAFAEIKAQSLLGVMVPAELGGEGATMSECAEICYTLGRACASTAMIYAMHLVKVACIVNHGMGVAWQEQILRRLDREQLLFASSTTEGMNGGNVRSSAAGIVDEGDGMISLDRDASVISYGAEADGIVTTAKRSPNAESSDQVLAVFMKEDYALDFTGGWDTLGMRGTCSTGFRLKAKGVKEQVLPVAYDRIHSQTMTPAAHLLWSAAWTGVAAAAVSKAQMFVRKAMRNANGQTPPGAARLGEAQAKLRQARNTLARSLERYESGHDDQRIWGTLDYQTQLTMTKVEVSELAVDAVMAAYRTCGLAGYRNDADVSIGRHLRDILSSPIMINNDRITASMAGAIVMTGVPNSIRN